MTITHDIGKALMATKVAVIENGKLVEFGVPNELLNKAGKFRCLYEAYQNTSVNN